MMRTVASRLLLLFPLLAAAGARAEEARKSLLFSPAEAAAIAKARADFERLNQVGPAVEEEAAPQTPNIYVSAIANYGGGRWTVWANGYRIVAGRQPASFTVLAVQDDYAVIKVSDEKQEKIVLRPSQTWLSRSHQVVEGIVP